MHAPVVVPISNKDLPRVLIHRHAHWGIAPVSGSRIRLACAAKAAQERPQSEEARKELGLKSREMESAIERLKRAIDASRTDQVPPTTPLTPRGVAVTGQESELIAAARLPMHQHILHHK